MATTTCKCGQSNPHLETPHCDPWPGIPLRSKLAGRTVCIDFDGVIHSYIRRWTGFVPEDPPEPGALEFVQQLLDDGAIVVVFTTRGSDDRGKQAVLGWLALWGFPVERLTVTDVKPSKAIAFVDDRAVAYVPGSGTWDTVRYAVESLAVRK